MTDRNPDWLADFDYDLPTDRIAREPASPRDSSRLLILDRETGSTTQTTFSRLDHLLQTGDLLVINETRVLRARLYTRLERTGREIELLLCHPESEGWAAMLGPGRRLRPGDRLLLKESTGTFRLDRRLESGMWRVIPECADPLAIMEAAGHIPLPPYLSRPDRAEDHDWYQTMFASEPGAVAAPTAGLHFTPDLLGRLDEAGVEIARAVLHVGPGTFLPVRAESVDQHRVLRERYHLPEDAAAKIARARESGKRVIAVGTTVVRTLETAFQGEPEGWTELTILPGYRFRAVDALITNFHLPRSSLLLLVSAFAGRRQILGAYREAVESGFRFYSYGDAMLIL